MKTSKIKIRPFIPLLDEDSEEPRAILSYGNITVELDYTILRYLCIDNESGIFAKPTSIGNAAIKEIEREMQFDMYGSLPNLHRDGNHPSLKSITHNPLHPSNKEVEIMELET